MGAKVEGLFLRACLGVLLPCLVSGVAQAQSAGTSHAPPSDPADTAETAEPAEAPTFVPVSPPAESTQPRATEPSYGGQIVLMDLGSLAFGTFGAMATKSTTPIILGAVGWSLGSPILHIVHGRPGQGALSFLLHVGLPIVGVATGVALASCSRRSSDDDDFFCGVTEALTFGILGMAAATIVDAAVLAQPRGDFAGPATRPTGPTSAPAVSVARNGEITVGWHGTF